MKKLAVFLVVLILLAAALACSIETPAPATATPDPNQLATAVASTLTALATPAAVSTSTAAVTPTPTVLPTDTVAPTTPAPVCLPVHPGAQSLPLPAGVAVGQTENIALYDLLGSLLANRPVAGMTFMDEHHAHLAGALSAGANAFPIAFFSLQGGGTLKQNANNAVSALFAAPKLTFLDGASGSAFLVYTDIDWSNQWTNTVYAGDMGSLAGMAPRFTWVPDETAHTGNAIQPLAVHSTAGVADGFWYTYTMVGIGDIQYPPYNGLYYFDLGTAASVEFLPPTDELGGLSPDQTLVAFGPGQGGTPGVIGNSVTIRNLFTCQDMVIPFDPSSNLGGGWMVFSPDNTKIAWTEAAGPSNMEATFRLRVARTDGTGMFNSPLANLGGFFGGEAPDALRPVGWAANHILAVEAYLEVVHSSVVGIWAPDPAQPIDPVLGAHQAVPLASGNFIGLLYP